MLIPILRLEIDQLFSYFINYLIFFFFFLISREPGELPEWAIVELQGSLEAYQNMIDPKSRKFIGDLLYQKNADGTPILIIGSIHILYGKEMPLAKPMILLEKKTIDDDDCGDNSTEHIVKGVVKRKLVFRGRPRPIVTHVPTST